jgi:ketosteroid isomerase-like protein
MRTSIIASTLFSIILLGCAPGAEPPSEADLAAIGATLMESDRAWFAEYSASDAPADVFAANVTAEAYLLPPGAPMVQGQDSIRRAITKLEAIPGFSVTWSPVGVEVSSGGEMGYTIGTYEMKMAPEGSPVTIDGKYITVWEKQADGGWRVTADMFNANGPPTPDEQ